MEIKKPYYAYMLSKPMQATFAAAAMSVALAGCTSTDVVNQHLITPSGETGLSMVQRLGSLPAGTPKSAVLELLGNPAEKDLSNVVGISRSISDIKEAYYGDVEVRGTPEEIEAFRQKIQDYEVWTIPFKSIEKEWRIGKGTYDTKQSGVDGKIVLIFDKNGTMVAGAKPTVNPGSDADKKAIFPSVIEGLIWTAPGVGLAL